MWERFTERARRAIFDAQAVAMRYGSSVVEPEHLLLTLMQDGDSVAVCVLAEMGIASARIRHDMESLMPPHQGGSDGKEMPLSQRGHRVILYAYEEARSLSNNYIGTEHLFLGLMREGQKLNRRVFSRFNLNIDRIRRRTMQFQDREAHTHPSAAEKEVSTDVTELVPLRMAIQDDPTLWRRKSLVSLFDVTTEQYRAVLDVAARLKALDQNRTPGIAWSYPRTLGMIFEKPSLRTRVSFEASMVHLRGHAIYLAPGDVGLGVRESIEDVAGVLSRWVDVIAARVFAHSTVEELAKYSTSPVINALSDQEHPIQSFADLLTLQEHKGPLGKHLKIAYIGDGNNVLHALLLACAKVGVNLTAACPEGYGPDPAYVEEAHRICQLENNGAGIAIVTDPSVAVQNADAVYTDVWASMGQESEKEARAKIFALYQVNTELLQHARPDVIVLHDLPAHRGEEITAEVMTAHKQSILDQAENRLHTQKALLALIVGL